MTDLQLNADDLARLRATRTEVARFNFLPEIPSLIETLDKILTAADPWAVESHQKNVNGHHLILASTSAHVHADVTLLSGRATVIFAGPSNRPHIASLTAHAAILQHMETLLSEDRLRLKVEASTYVLQIVGAQCWEVLRPVFGEAYAGAVL